MRCIGNLLRCTIQVQRRAAVFTAAILPHIPNKRLADGPTSLSHIAKWDKWEQGPEMNRLPGISNDES